MSSGKVIITSKHGELELIVNDTILLLDKSDIINVKLPPQASNWTIRFLFTHDEAKPIASYREEIVDDGKTIQISMNKWYSSTWIENTIPYKFAATTKTFEIFVKIRTTATENKDVRTVIINVWFKKLATAATV